MLNFDPPRDEHPTPKEGEPALHRAARIGDIAEIRRLVAAGESLESVFNTELDPDALDREATPFMVAAGSSDGASVETLRVLLELGADPKRVINGRSAATFACQGLYGWHKPGGDAARLRFVLQAGCPLPEDLGRANRLLCDTASIGDVERLQILLDNGLNARGHWDAAKARESHRQMMERFASKRSSEPDAFASLPDDLRTSMTESMRKMEEDMFEQVCSGPSNLEIPLFCAAESGHAECVRALLAAGAYVRVRDSSKRTAMYHAGSAEVVQLLLQAGLKLEDEDTYGWPPLSGAISDGESALPRVKALIAAGANVNATHDRGYTVFMSAVGSSRYPALLRTLIAAGADPHAVSELGYNAFHAAIDVNFEANAEESVRDTLGYLKELGVNIEQRNSNNHTPLAYAIERGTGLEVQVLCELGANPNAVCPKHECGGESCTRLELPLLFHAASGIGTSKDVKVDALLRAGADPQVKDKEGCMPLLHVVASLCRDATDYTASYRAFFQGLNGLRLPDNPARWSRDEFVAVAAPLIRAYVEQFASAIPVPNTCDFDAQWRQEKISCIVSLAAYWWWAGYEPNKQDEPT